VACLARSLLASHIETLSERLERRQEILPREGPSSVEEWLARAADPAPEDLGPLLTALCFGDPGADARCYQRLLTLPHDPRIATAMIAAITNGNSDEWFIGEEPFIGGLMNEVLVAHADPRTLKDLAEFPSWMKEIDCNGASMLDLVELTRDKLRDRFPGGATDGPAPPPLPADRVHDMVAQVLEAPFNLTLRQVLADLLLDEGDPWGEVINLQLRGEDASAVIARHGRRWMRGLEPALASARFENGFPSHVELRKEFPLRWHGQLQEWRTVSSVRFGGLSIWWLLEDKPWIRRVESASDLDFLDDLDTELPGVHEVIMDAPISPAERAILERRLPNLRIVSESPGDTGRSRRPLRS
jgi:hypothetical protein